MEPVDRDPGTDKQPDPKDEAAIRREKFLAAMKGKRNQDAGPYSQETGSDGVKRGRGESQKKSKVRRRPRNV